LTLNGHGGMRLRLQVWANVAAAGAMGKEVDWERLFGDMQVDQPMARSVQEATAAECSALHAAGSTEGVRMKVCTLGGSCRTADSAGGVCGRLVEDFQSALISHRGDSLSRSQSFVLFDVRAARHTSAAEATATGARMVRGMPYEC